MKGRFFESSLVQTRKEGTRGSFREVGRETPKEVLPEGEKREEVGKILLSSGRRKVYK